MIRMTHTKEGQLVLFDDSELPLSPIPSKRKHPHDMRKAFKRELIGRYITRKLG